MERENEADKDKIYENDVVRCAIEVNRLDFQQWRELQAGKEDVRIC